YPAEDLLAIVALESQRARAVVVGEDLGTVEAGVRERLSELAVLSYRVVLFEPNPPAQYPELALAAVTTHDLPTLAGIWTAEDLPAVVALERQGARAVVVGEDLGTVEAGVRERLSELAVLSYRVVLFEPNPPAQYPELALAAVTTHDLPTLAGIWTGADLQA